MSAHAIVAAIPGTRALWHRAVMLHAPLALQPLRRLAVRLLSLPWLLAPTLPWAAPPACPPALPAPDAATVQPARAQDRGFLWTLQRDGRTSYLYGTLHVGKPGWTVPGPRVAAALAASDVLALEIDPGDPAVQQALASAGSGAPLVLPPALRARLQRQIDAACLAGTAVATMDPAMQAMLLGVLEARWVGLDPAYAQEQALAADARRAGRAIVSLESVALQKKILLPDKADDALAMITQTLDQLEDGRGRSVIARLAAAWAQGDLDTLTHYADWCDCERNDDERSQMRALNDARNPGLADGIAALHGQGRRVFAAVGALHMTGAQGLPRLLADRGFTVTRVPF